MELGLYTFGDLVPDAHGRVISGAERLRQIVEAARLAEQVGLDVFGVGEHHRLDCTISSPAVVLAAIAQATVRLRLTSATTVLPTLDPVRVFEDFATLDLLSNGRAEILVGRGAFVESFPLFGYDREQRDALFAEHLELLLKLNDRERVTWGGRHRPSLSDAEIAPRPVNGRVPVWVGIGATPESAARAARLGLPMNLAILGTWDRMKPLADVYWTAGREAGTSAGLRVAVSSHFFVQKTSQAARDVFHPHHARYFQKMGRPGLSRADFDAIVNPADGLLVGSPQEIVDKILRAKEAFGLDRYMAQLDVGGMPFERVAEAIELFGTEIAPAVRKHAG